MTYHPNLATILIRLRDVDGHAVIASTDGHHVRLLLRDRDEPENDWRYVDLDARTADTLAAVLAGHARLRLLRRGMWWRRLRGDRR
ncbi:hypothetical protein [Nocardia amamiensis]|uniref:hypothetical protein n=1 Tax=Nocardia amamiensis TaxID=404578 RepID=UPI00082D46EC|nr:hypothetical protein [Nocardia amamiensis]